jgi:hypothetical protein
MSQELVCSRSRSPRESVRHDFDEMIDCNPMEEAELLAELENEMPESSPVDLPQEEAPKFKEIIVTVPTDVQTIGLSVTPVFQGSSSTRPVLLEYLMNGSRFASRNPGVAMMSGTRRNEAYHQQLKSMFRNVMFQTGRNAQVVADIATLVKLLAGLMKRKCPLTVQHREHDLVRHVAASLMDDPLKFEPLMEHKVVKDLVVISSELPPNVKTMRKRPASAAPAQALKRPSAAGR